MTIARKPSIHDRVAAVLKGERPDRLPFIDRLELWHKGLLHTGTLPNAYRDLPLTEIHRRVGMGQQKFLSPYSLRLRGTEVIVHFEGKVIHREIDPVVER